MESASFVEAQSLLKSGRITLEEYLEMLYGPVKLEPQVVDTFYPTRKGKETY